MLFDGLEILEGSQVVNFSLPTGASFPTSPDQGEVFYKTDVKKPYIYIDTAWVEMSTGGSSNSNTGVVTIVSSISGVTGNEGDLVYAVGAGKLYVHDGSAFVECFTETNPKPVTVVASMIDAQSQQQIAGVSGQLVYSTADSKLFVHNGTSFVECFIENNPKPVSIVSSLPTGTQGELAFNSTNSKLYVKTSSAWVSTTPDNVYDIAITSPGDITAASTIVFFVAARTITIPQAFTGSRAAIGTNNGDAVFTMYKNGSSVATISFTGSSTVGVFSASADISFAEGDVMSIDSPSSNAPSNLAITIRATI